MPRPTLIAVLIASAVAIIPPASSSAVTLHIHRQIVVHPVVGHELRGAEMRTVERVVRLPAADSDDDGFSDAEDNCPSDGYTGNGGCTPPPPDPAPTSTSAPEGEVAIYAAPAGSCPASLAGESTSPTAVNGDSGAAGCIQAIPSTWAEYGDPAYASAAEAPVDVQMEAMARICAAQGNDAWTAADPC